MLQMLRRNPDAVALAVVCLLLGVAKSTGNTWMTQRLPARIAIHSVWAAPGPAALDDLRQKLPNLKNLRPCVPPEF